MEPGNFLRKNGCGWIWEIFYRKIRIWMDMDPAERGGVEWASEFCPVKGSTQDWKRYEQSRDLVQTHRPVFSSKLHDHQGPIARGGYTPWPSAFWELPWPGEGYSAPLLPSKCLRADWSKVLTTTNQKAVYSSLWRVNVMYDAATVSNQLVATIWQDIADTCRRWATNFRWYYGMSEEYPQR